MQARECLKQQEITLLQKWKCGSLAINIASFAHLLKRVDFDAVVDHLAITHIMKSKMEPATNRIKRLLEVLSSYLFNLYYIKAKDMILSDFLSRQIEDDSNPSKIIPISFNIQEILQEKLPQHGNRHLQGAKESASKRPSKCPHSSECPTGSTES